MKLMQKCPKAVGMQTREQSTRASRPNIPGGNRVLTQKAKQELRKSPPPAISPPALSKIAANGACHTAAMARETKAAQSTSPAAIDVVAAGPHLDVPRSSVSSTR
jgi:hypothetical protein